MHPRPLLVLIAPSLLASCTIVVPVPDVGPDAPGFTEAWTRVLDERVDDEGHVDFAGLAADPADLHAAVADVARSSPRSHPERFPRPADELAYWINAYNALAMYNAIHGDVLPSSKITFFWRRELTVGGERISLYDLENDVIRPLGDPRIHFALNCMVRSCPRLPRAPFVADALDAQLDAATREFLDDPRHVRVEAGVVYLSRILDWYDEDFLAVAPSLLEYVARYRAERLPAGARVAWLDYDWTRNDPPGRAAGR